MSIEKKRNICRTQNYSKYIISNMGYVIREYIIVIIMK